MTDSSIALAKFARTAAGAFLTLAADLESAAATLPDLADDADIEIPVGRGERQQQVLDVSGLAAEMGMKTADIAREIDYEVPNTHSTLQSLERAGLVEMVPGVSPQRWRLAPRYRANSTVFKRVASRLRPEEWTTYGDISIAVRGDTKAARGVGRAAATLSDFPNAERVLMDGGVINPNWHDDAGHGPDYCRQLLEDGGIRFVNDRADAAQRVAWDELRRRDEAEPVAD